MPNTLTPSEGHIRAMRARGDSFAQFMRNGVWGTCAACPRSEGKAYPEFCKNGHRSDHQLSLADLAEAYQVYQR